MFEREAEASSNLLRLGDLVIASALILFTLPLMVFVGLAIKLDSVGPIFCQQARMGSNGRLFNALKFRTTEYDPEQPSRPAWDSGVRETRVGQLLRHTRIDDVPQLANVLRGELSLVPEGARNFRKLARWGVWVAIAAAAGALFQGGGSVLQLLAE